MRIGEVAELLGVTTRTVRHYHRTGVVPEPARRDNGYRDYGLRDAIGLMRAVRLAALGLSLDEVADALRDDDMRELPDILRELDGDLARQEHEIRRRRAALQTVLSRVVEPTGERRPDDMFLSDEAVDLFTSLQTLGAGSHSLEIDRRIMSALPDEAARAWTTVMSHDDSAGAAPAGTARMAEIYRRFDDLGHGDAATRTADPAVPQLARDLLAAVPESLRAQFHADPDAEVPFLDAVADDLSPAQAAVIRHLLTLRGSE